MSKSNSQQIACPEQLQDNSRSIQNVFSGPGGFHILLESPRADYVLGEPIPFAVNFINPQRLQILCVSVKLRQVLYFCRTLVRSVVDTVEVFVGKRSQAPQFSIGGAFSGKNIYLASDPKDPTMKIRYYIKCDAILETSEGKKSTALCEIGLTISRKKRISDTILNGSAEQSVAENQGTNSLSATTSSSLPPSYSQLSSRATSVMSLESLPPRYDDLHRT